VNDSPRLAELLHHGRLAWRLLGDRRVPLALKVIPALAIGYLIMPFDFDFVPGIGHVDDLLVIILAIRAFIELVPDEILRDYTNDDTVTATYRVQE
jgi:uncharacterized membrane protein YkvA (DUF1232 family)